MATTKKAGAAKQASAGKTASKKAAPKKAAHRADYGEPIDTWFEQQAPDKRALLERLRALVEATVPTARSGLKWGVPFYSLDGKILCNMVVLKREVALGIYAPPKAFDDPDGRLQGKSNEYRVLKVRDESEIDPASVRRWLLAAVAAASA